LKCAGTSIIYNRISPKFSHVVETNVRNNGIVISSRNLRYLCSLVCQTLVTNESTAAKNKQWFFPWTELTGWCVQHIAHLRQECHNSKFEIFEL
jgi:hypothetical protein